MEIKNMKDSEKLTAILRILTYIWILLCVWFGIWIFFAI
jgi:hypothetical protein